MSTPQVVEILFLAMIAMILVFRLKGAMGQRGGHEKIMPELGDAKRCNREMLSRERKSSTLDPKNLPINEEGELDFLGGLVSPDVSMGKTLADVREIDKKFSLKTFVDGTKQAYNMLLTAYYAGDRETLKKFMDAEVLSTFVKNIEDRGNDGLTVSFQFVYVSSVEIVDVNLFEGNAYLEITVKFVADVVLSVKDQNGELVSGDPEKIKKIKDVWTFGRDLRSESPNWMVVETGE